MAPQALYYCDEHIAANPGANLITAGLSRALPSKPHFTVEGALGKSIVFVSTVKDLQESGEASKAS